MERETYGDIRQGFVYKRVPHITLESIANNPEIDLIWEQCRETLESLRAALNDALGQNWDEWQIPLRADDSWPSGAAEIHHRWKAAFVNRRNKINEAIAANGNCEYFYDDPYSDNGKIRVAGPFTVESLSPHRSLVVGEDDQIVDPADNLPPPPPERSSAI